MSALFDVEWMGGAAFSDCGLYRYSLWRHWGERGGKRLVVIGLNPSTADETTDDPTIRRCIGFAKREGMAGLTMLNLFAYRATNPRDMYDSYEAGIDIIGPQNDAMIRQAIGADDLVVAAWGVHGELCRRGAFVVRTLPHVRCFGVTKDHHPRHPLYLRADSPLVPYVFP